MNAVLENNSLVKKFSLLLQLTDNEKDILLGLQDDCEKIPPGAELVTAGHELSYTYIIQDGWGFNYKLLIDGRQQILNFLLRGDFIGLYAAVFRNSENSVKALTELTVCKIEPIKIISVFKEAPRLAAAMCWSAARDEAILGEHITRLGRRSAYNRTGHLLLELLRRLESVDLVDSNSFEFPLTQGLLADTLGLTVVHMNRTLRALKNDGMISMDGKRITILKRAELREAVGFDPVYLEQNELSDKIGSQIN